MSKFNYTDDFAQPLSLPFAVDIVPGVTTNPEDFSKQVSLPLSVDDIKLSSVVGLFFNIKKSGIVINRTLSPRHLVSSEKSPGSIHSNRSSPSISSSRYSSYSSSVQNHSAIMANPTSYSWDVSQASNAHAQPQSYNYGTLENPLYSNNLKDTKTQLHHIAEKPNQQQLLERQVLQQLLQSDLSPPRYLSADARNNESVPSLDTSSVSDVASINTQDALQLISTGVKLDHTDTLAPRPTPVTNSPVSCLSPNAPSENSFANSVPSSVERVDKNQKSSMKDIPSENLKNRHGSIHKSSPNLVIPSSKSLENVSKKNKSTSSFFKRFSLLSMSSASEAPVPITDSDTVINKHQKTQFNNSELLNSMKAKNITVVNLQNTKKETKRQLKKKRKEEKKRKEKEDSLKYQRQKLKEYYKKHEDVVPTVPPAFLLDTHFNKFVPEPVLTKAEKTFPQSVKRASILPAPEKPPHPTPINGLSKSSTKRYSDPTQGGYPSFNSVPSNKRNTIAAPQNKQTTPSNRNSSPNGLTESGLHYIPSNSLPISSYGYCNVASDLYTLSEKSIEQSLHSRNPSKVSKFILSPQTSPLQEQFTASYLKPPKNTATYSLNPTSNESINSPVLNDYSSALVYSLDFYSASSGSDDEKQVKHTPKHDSFLEDDDFTNQVVSQLAKEGTISNNTVNPQILTKNPTGRSLPQPPFSPPPIPEDEPYPPVSSSNSLLPQPNYPAPEPIPQAEFEPLAASQDMMVSPQLPPSGTNMKGHYYKLLARMGLEKSFSSTKVRVNYNYNEIDSDM